MSINLKILVSFKMNKIFRLKSSVCSKFNILPDIINVEDYFVEKNDCPNFNKWCISNIDAKYIYKSNWIQFAFKIEFNVKYIEHRYIISRAHEKCCLFAKKSLMVFRLEDINSRIWVMYKLLLSLLHVRDVVLICLKDIARFKKFETNILDRIQLSFFNSSVHFNCFSYLTLT